MSQIITDLHLRAYFASVIGGFRQPFGLRSGFVLGAATGTRQQLAQNSTRDRVLSVNVSRGGTVGGTAVCTFTQNVNGAGSSDFAVSFTSTSSFRFILYPGDTLTIQQNPLSIAIDLVVQQETW